MEIAPVSAIRPIPAIRPHATTRNPRDLPAFSSIFAVENDTRLDEESHHASEQEPGHRMEEDDLYIPATDEDDALPPVQMEEPGPGQRLNFIV